MNFSFSKKKKMVPQRNPKTREGFFSGWLPLLVSENVFCLHYCKSCNQSKFCALSTVQFPMSNVHCPLSTGGVCRLANNGHVLHFLLEDDTCAVYS